MKSGTLCIIVFLIAIILIRYPQPQAQAPYFVADDHLYLFFKGYVKSCATPPQLLEADGKGGWQGVAQGEPAAACEMDVCVNIFDSPVHRLPLFKIVNGNHVPLKGPLKTQVFYYSDAACTDRKILSFGFTGRP